MINEYINSKFLELDQNNSTILKQIFLPSLIYSFNQNQYTNFEDFLNEINLHTLSEIYPQGMHLYDHIKKQLDADKTELLKLTSQECTPIGDIHPNGLTKFTDNENVYHKSDNNGSILLKSILDYLQLDVCLVPNEKLKDNYHIREYIPVKNNTINKSDIEEYFYNLGQVVPILLACTTYDLIRPNLIVHGTKPVFFDLDCIFYPRVKYEFEEYTYSITSTRMFRSNYSRQMSGIRGGLDPIPNAIDPVIQLVDNIPTITWGILEKANQENLIKLNGIAQDVKDYMSNFLDGYDKSVDLIIKNKRKILDIILNYKGSSRYVLRSTHTYKAIMMAYNLPPIYQNYDREQYIREQLTKKHVMHIPNLDLDKLINDELSKLMIGNIPYYKGYLHTTDVVNEYNDKVASLITSPLENLINHFNSFEDYFPKQKLMLLNSINDSFMKFD